MIVFFIIFPIVSFLFVVFNFIYFIINKRQKTNNTYFLIIELWTVAITPILFLLFLDIFQENDCCNDSAVFSPEHKIGIYVIIISYTVAFLISIFREQLFTPILELLLNLFLILGFVLNILLCVHLNTLESGPFYWIFGNIPILMLILMKLYKHQSLLRTYINDNKIVVNGFVGKLSLSILKLEPIIKYPILLLMLVPVIILLSLFLMLFGQKPDAMIKAFTDTYKHGFSQLDYKCDNVNCGGHFLCSVGAKGHKSIVKPMRYGERNGEKIICNRQLLISNAFEDLIQEKFPSAHLLIRKQYNTIGHFVHHYYNIFNIKVVSDIVYFLMKPLEWLFLFTLYIFDRKPENRIEKQYLSKKDRQLIDEKINGIPSFVQADSPPGTCAN